MKSINELKNLNFQIDGLEIHDIYTEEEINNLSVDFYNRVLLQAYKIGLKKDFNFKNYGEIVDPKELDSLVIGVNSKNKRSLDFAVQELRECPAFTALINKKFVKKSSEVLNCPESLLKIHIDGILINIPSNKQRLYRFHSEQHYYPYRRNFFNFWMPVVRNKTEDNGAMIVKHKGHNKSYQFNEYSGFNKVEGYEASEENFFYQLEIPSVEIDEFESMMTDIEVGKCLFFNSNLPHTSKINDSEEVSYSVIMRVYDYRKDLTLSDRTGIKSYQASGGGYPDIQPVTESK